MPNANIDYVTSHQGQAHITTQNVIDLLAGISGDISGIKKFPQLYYGLANEITEALTIQVKTGAALVGGSFFILVDPFDWLLDAGAVGYSRIDILYLVMYEDPETNVQSCDFVYQVGDLYPNGTTGTAPSAPTGTDITATYPFLRMDMTDGSIVSVTDYAVSYLSNSSLVEEVESYSEQVITNKNDIAQMKVDFQAGVDAVIGALAAVGIVIPAGSTPQDVASAVIASNKGAWTGTGTPTGNNQVNVAIPAGYHSGNGYVTCKGQSSYSAGETKGHNDTKTTTLSASATYSEMLHRIYLQVSIGNTMMINVWVPDTQHSASTTIKYGFTNGITKN